MNNDRLPRSCSGIYIFLAVERDGFPSQLGDTFHETPHLSCSRGRKGRWRSDITDVTGLRSGWSRLAVCPDGAGDRNLPGGVHCSPQALPCGHLPISFLPDGLRVEKIPSKVATERRPSAWSRLDTEQVKTSDFSEFVLSPRQLLQITHTFPVSRPLVWVPGGSAQSKARLGWI